MPLSNKSAQSILIILALSMASGCQTDKDLVTASTGNENSGVSHGDTNRTSKVSLAYGNEADAEAGSVKEPADPKLKATVLPENDFTTYAPPKTGTIFVFRNNWASLPPVITYKVDGAVDVGNARYLKMTAIFGMKEKISVYYDMQNFSLKGYRDAKDRAILTYKPMDQRYRFPMKPGDQWVTSWRSYDHRKKEELKGGGVVKVIKKETLKLPSGVFETMKVKLPTARDLPAGMTHYVWFAPELGVTVKEQVGNANMNWIQILQEVQFPPAES